MTDLSSRALLTNLSISEWSARKYDKRETAELMFKHNLNANVARVNKSLLPMADSLDLIHKKTGEIRTDYYKHSLPWGLDGVQIIRSESYMDFVKMMRDHIYAWRQLASNFVAEYPRLKADARLTLNGLYREEDYPDADTIARKFNIDIRFFPVPSTADFRVSLADEEMREIKQQLARQVRESEASAMRTAWDRVHKLIAKTKERLSDPEAVFRDSLVENARELCKILPTLNLADDPDLERVRSELEGSICRHDPVTLRTAPDVRADVARKMAELDAKFGGLYSTAA